MLVLERGLGEEVVIYEEGDEPREEREVARVKITKVKSGKRGLVKLGIEADGLKILRGELADQEGQD